MMKRFLLTIFLLITGLNAQLMPGWNNDDFFIPDKLIPTKLGSKVIYVGTHAYFTYNTVDDAINAASTGDVIMVLPGTYTGFIDADVANITIKSVEGPERTTLALTMTGNAGIDIGADGVVLDGFTLTGDAAGSIIEINDSADDVIIQNCVINSTGSATFGYSISTSGASGPIVRNNKFLSNAGDGCIWINKTVDDMQIYNNLFLGQDNTSGYAIQMGGFNEFEIYNNVIRAADGSVAGSFASGIFPHTAVSGPAASDFVYIYNNDISDCDRAVRIGHTSMTATVDDIFVLNNNFRNNTTAIWISSDAQNDPSTFSVNGNVFHDNTADITNNHVTDLADGTYLLEESLLTRDVTISDATPALNWKDRSATDDDISAYIQVDLTNTGSGTEDADFQIFQQVAGVASRTVFSDADQGIWFYPSGSTTGYFAVTTSDNQIQMIMDGDKDILIDGTTDDRDINTGTMRFEQKPNAINNSSRAITFNVDNNNAQDTHAAIVNFTATGLAPGEHGGAWDVNLISDGATGGILSGLHVFAGGTGTIDNFYGVIIEPGVDVLAQNSGAFGNVDIAFSFESAAYIDRTAAFNATGTDVELFAADNDVVYIGMTVTWSTLDVNLAIGASGPGIKPTFEYVDATGTWTVYTPTDNTTGFKVSANIAWMIADLVTPAWGGRTIFEVTGAGDNVQDYFWIRITRTQNTLITAPTENLIQASTTSLYSWDKDAIVSISKLIVDASGNYLDVSTDFDFVSAADMVLTPTGAEVHVMGGLSVGDETDVGDNNFKVVGTSLLEGNTTFTTAGVVVSAADGVMTFLGAGDGNDLNLIWDYDNHATATTIGVSSGAATVIDWGSISHVTTGSISSPPTQVASTADDTESVTHNLGYRPDVWVYRTADEIVIDAQIDHTDVNTFVITTSVVVNFTVNYR